MAIGEKNSFNWPRLKSEFCPKRGAIRVGVFLGAFFGNAEMVFRYIVAMCISTIPADCKQIMKFVLCYELVNKMISLV